MKNRKLISLKRLAFTFIVISPFLLFAKGTMVTPESEIMNFILHNLVLIVGAIVVIIGFVQIFRFIFLLINIQKKRIYKDRGIDFPIETAKTSIWNRMYDWAVNLNPIEEEEDILLNHNYDGIQELDNSLPPWWVAMFYITILIGGVYFTYYHYFDYGLSSSEEYALEMKYANEAKARFMEKQANLIDESNVTQITDPNMIASGAAIYNSYCVACHGALGEGGVGPNLTDNYWLHGTGDIKSVFKTIKYGVPQKGMIAWKTQLRPADIHQVSSFILTLIGTNPPNGKEPEGIQVQHGETEEAEPDPALGMK